MRCAAPRCARTPTYELIPLERLADGEREVLAVNADADDLYGLLRPGPGSSLAPRSVTVDLALLLLTLRDPGPLPAFAAQRLGAEAEDASPGSCSTACSSSSRTGGSSPGRAGSAGPRTRPARGDAVALLSLAALRHAQSLGDLPEAILTSCLYGFGRRPFTPSLASRLPNETAVGGVPLRGGRRRAGELGRIRIGARRPLADVAPA